MARPRKENAEYFSHDNDMRNHRKIKAIRNKFGLEGYAVFNMLLETLTEAENFKIKLSKDLDFELLASDFGISKELLTEMISYFISLELLINNEGSYWCENLVDRLAPLVEKRELLRQKYSNNLVSTAETNVSVEEMPQSKVNKTKVNNIKENNNIIPTEQSSGGTSNNINSILDEFYEINPTISYGNPSQRNAVEFLLNKFGYNELLAMVKWYKQNMGDRFCPSATTPLAFKSKFGDIKAYADKLKNKQSNVIKI